MRARLKRARAELDRKQSEKEPVDVEAGGNRDEIAKLRSTVTRLDAALESVKKELAESRNKLRLERQALARYGDDGAEELLIHRMENFDFGGYHALVIGNGAYPQLRGGELKSAVNDAEAVAQLLEERYGYQVLPLYNAKRSDILNAFRVLSEELTSNDNLLVYYAGHGEFRNDQGYWLANDFGEDPNAAIPTSEITGILRSLEAKHVMVIADSCYARALIEDSVQQPYGVADSQREVWIRATADFHLRVAMTSGGLKPVPDNAGGRHSIFAAALLKQLGTSRDIVEGTRLFWSITADVKQAAKDLGLEQSPTYSSIKRGDDSGSDYFFVPRGSS